MSPTKMLGTDGTKALAPSTVQRLSARTSSGTPLHWGQVPTSLLHVLAVKSHPTPEYAWEGVELALSSTNAIEHLSLPYDPASRRLFGVAVRRTSAARPGPACGSQHNQRADLRVCRPTNTANGANGQHQVLPQLEGPLAVPAGRTSVSSVDAPPASRLALPTTSPTAAATPSVGAADDQPRNRRQGQGDNRIREVPANAQRSSPAVREWKGPPAHSGGPIPLPTPEGTFDTPKARIGTRNEQTGPRADADAAVRPDRTAADLEHAMTYPRSGRTRP